MDLSNSWKFGEVVFLNRVDIDKVIFEWKFEGDESIVMEMFREGFLGRVELEYKFGGSCFSLCLRSLI